MTKLYCDYCEGEINNRYKNAPIKILATNKTPGIEITFFNKDGIIPDVCDTCIFDTILNDKRFKNNKI